MGEVRALRVKPFKGGAATPKASPERGGARFAGGGVPSPAPQGHGGFVSRRDRNPKNRETRPTRKGAQVRRKSQAYSPPLFGWEREGGASLREAASPGVPIFPYS